MLILTALVLSTLLINSVAALPTQGVATEVSKFTLEKSPSGLFFNEQQNLLYVLCGTQTNRDHYLYAYTTDGVKQCLMTIPEAAGMTRVDGFYIVGDEAFIVDSQGPIYADDAGRLGGSIYVVDWTNPCECADGVCAKSDVTWSPTVKSTITLLHDDESINDGGTAFRNSGIVVKDNFAFAVNGVHPNPTLTCCYPKSLIKVALNDTAGESAKAVEKWSFNATQLGHDVDMEGLSCGADGCQQYLYIGDEYNYIYRLSLDESDVDAAVDFEWNVRSIVGAVPDDKGIESLTYAPSTGYFYAGIQETSVVHVLALSTSDSTDEPSTTSDAPSSSTAAGSDTTAAQTTSNNNIDTDSISNPVPEATSDASSWYLSTTVLVIASILYI